MQKTKKTSKATGTKKTAKKAEIRKTLDRMNIKLSADQCQCGYAEPTRYAVITKDKFGK